MTKMKDGRICLSKDGTQNVINETFHPNVEAMYKRDKTIAEAEIYKYLEDGTTEIDVQI